MSLQLLIDIEGLTEKELEIFSRYYKKLAEMAKKKPIFQRLILQKKQPSCIKYHSKKPDIEE
ncbi:MAG: hypothetical protein ACXVNO_05105 [Bacteroidia bacterium]